MSTPFVLKRTAVDSHVARMMGEIPTPVLLLADELATKAAASGHKAMG
jgi:hypothetical protein